MSSSQPVRRTDKLMSSSKIDTLLSTGYCGHLGTVDAEGAPYVCPLLYVWLNGYIWLHNTSAEGHLRSNVRHNPRACFEVAVPGKVFPYGRFQCDTSIEYQSVVIFGRLTIVEDRALKASFFDALMGKYYGDDMTRVSGFYPRLDEVTVYTLSVERITGKETTLPALESQWPVADNTKSPNALPPRDADESCR